MNLKLKKVRFCGTMGITLLDTDIDGLFDPADKTERAPRWRREPARAGFVRFCAFFASFLAGFASFLALMSSF